MTICITNCFHWIGFHITNRLLEDGYNVDGIADMNTEKEEDLSLMLGRNSMFSLYNSENEIKEKEYTDVILIDKSKVRAIPSGKTYALGISTEEPTVIKLELPLLFGEWMPMDENGVYVNDKYIKFDSSQFQNEAIYIDNFLDCFTQWMRATDLPQSITLTRDKTLQCEKKSLAKQMYIRENRPIEDEITSLINHYKKIKKFKL